MRQFDGELEGLPALSIWFRPGEWGKLARVAWQLGATREVLPGA